MAAYTSFPRCINVVSCAAGHELRWHEHGHRFVSKAIVVESLLQRRTSLLSLHGDEHSECDERSGKTSNAVFIKVVIISSKSCYLWCAVHDLSPMTTAFEWSMPMLGEVPALCRVDKYSKVPGTDAVR